jgi:hypothetical protein
MRLLLSLYVCPSIGMRLLWSQCLVAARRSQMSPVRKHVSEVHRQHTQDKETLRTVYVHCKSSPRGRWNFQPPYRMRLISWAVKSKYTLSVYINRSVRYIDRNSALGTWVPQGQDANSQTRFSPVRCFGHVHTACVTAPDCRFHALHANS